MELEDLEVYKLSRELSRVFWSVYKEMSRNVRHLIGNQTLRAIDSIGANIAEGFGRFHYLDSLRFYYNARGSLWESKHWVDILNERKLISQNIYTTLNENLDALGIKLNNFIKAIKRQIDSDKDE
ncbi:MAG: four helix bundle protein [Nitrospirae bacterium]|nr:MAG: four helix bundle protein [Nitrospirota bacterium]